MRLVAGILVAAAVLALLVAREVEFRRHWLPQLERPVEGWLWERPWRHRALVWATLTVSILIAVILIITVPPNSGAETITRAVFLVLIVGAGLLAKRADRRKGLKAARPLMQHGPPGWEWDADAATWREPR